MSSYFEDGLFGSQIGNDINNDIVIEAYQSLEGSEMDQIGAMPPAMPPSVPPSMPPFSPRHFQPPHHPAPTFLNQGMGSPQHFQPQHHPAPTFLNQGMGAWEPTFPGGQFGNLPAEPRALFVDPELCDRAMDSDDMRSQIQALEAEVSRRPTTRAQSQALENGLSRPPSTRRTSSSKSESQSSTRSDNSLTDITPPDQSQPKKRKSNKKKGPSEGEDEQKRNKFLERNRIAASKCREKKKKSMWELEQTKIQLEAKHSHMQTERSNLASTVANLKHELMMHAKCSDPRINKWLQGQAEQYVDTPAPAPPASSAAPPASSAAPPTSSAPSSSHVSGQGYTGFNPSGPSVPPAESPRGGQGYTASNPPGPPALPAESSPRGRQLSLPMTYHPMYPGSFSMGGGEGQNALYDAMGAAEGQLRPFDPMFARDGQSGQFGLTGAGERQNSIAYSHASSMYTEPTPVDPIFPCLNSPHPKRDPDSVNYDHMPDELLDPDQSPYGPA